ncbi:hypothetical protein BJY52DRAFT_1187881 [Lactarius psammicola]|nr:hypothetical protein BJY52DRAFT_1187881 [Lactarius psammicola]
MDTVMPASGYTERIADLERRESLPLDELGGETRPWTLEGPFDPKAKSHDEAQFLSLKADMDGVLLFAGLFSAVITSFFVQSIQNLQVDPAKQSAYHQEQSVAMPAQISLQIASIALQVSIPFIAPQVSAPPTVSQSSAPSSAKTRIRPIHFPTTLSCI